MDATASHYHEVYAQWRRDPEGFWAQAADEIDWIEPAKKVFDPSMGVYGQWFAGGVLNTCYNALDRHVAGGRARQAALIYDSPVTGTQSSFSYEELLFEVKTLAAILQDFGVGKGDRVIIYMPLVPEAVVAMLACARIGAVHSVVFGGFAAKELAKRIDDARPKLILSASCGIEPGRIVKYKPLLDEAVAMAQFKPQACIVLQRPQEQASMVEGRDHDWATLRDAAIAAKKSADCVPVLATDPLYILYTSGTTGIPKGVVRDNGGHAVALKWSMKNLYGVDPGEVWWCGSDIGWVVGHSYIVYGPLLVGATTVMYEGKPVGTPDAGAFWRIISEYGVRALFTAPTAIRAVRKADPNAEELKKYDISSLRTLFAAGERLDPDTYEWATAVLGRPVVDHWWQTETGWAIAANLRGLEPMPLKAGSPTVPVPGYRVEIVDGEGKPVEAGTEGNIVIALPLPPGTLTGLWRDEDRYRRSYLDTFPGYYLTGDSGYIDEDGYVFVLGRSDDVINVAGHRLSTGSMEAVVASHPAVAECAVIGIRDELKGQRPSGYVVLKAGVEIDPETLRQELVAMVREQIGAVATFRDVTVVQALPKTRSGKILRKTMRQIADHEQYTVPSTIEDPAVLEALERQLGG